jgi:uncharacterized membrane protein
MSNKFDEMAKGLAQSVTRRQALRKFSVGLAGMALACFGLANKAEAGGPTFTMIDFPGAVATLAVDINSSGQIVGEYTFTTLDNRQGFLLSNGTFTSITFPGASFTRAIGINRYGDIVGDYVLQGSGNSNEHGYLLRGGVFTTISVPNADATLAQGINASGDIVGTYINKQGEHGFLLHGGTFTSIDFPGAAAYTEAWKINDNGEIVGRYKGGDSRYHVYVLSNGSYTSVPDVPGAVQVAPGSFSEAGGVDNFGNIVSSFGSSEPCDLGSAGNVHGFVLSGATYTAVDFPGANVTLAFGINDSGQVVGPYKDASGIHGYLRTP